MLCACAKPVDTSRPQPFSPAYLVRKLDTPETTTGEGCNGVAVVGLCRHSTSECMPTSLEGSRDWQTGQRSVIDFGARRRPKEIFEEAHGEFGAAPLDLRAAGDSRTCKACRRRQ